MYCPVPLPSEVFESEMDGLDDVLQQTPLAVTAALPSEVMLPPLLAVVRLMFVTGKVFSTGSDAVADFLQLLKLKPAPVSTKSKNNFLIFSDD